MIRRAAGPAVFTLALLAGAVLPTGAAAQSHVFGVETSFLGYSFDEGLGAEAAQLLMIPVAYRVPLGDQGRFQLDFYSAWARGMVEADGAEFTLDGFVDTQVKASFRATPWAILSLTANLPTGNNAHDSEEAVVAAVLSSDLLGFRETNWGTGFNLATGLATATQVGSWGVGLGGSYRLASEFEPVADTALGYEPGDEVRVRLAADRNFGESGTLNLGATWQNFSEDQLEGRNLFQAGNRLSADASISGRLGGEIWTVWAANVWREEGDRSLDIVGEGGAVVGDTTLATPSQNLFLAGLTGAIPVGGLYRLRPSADVRVVSRSQEVDAADPEARAEDEGSGVLVGIGVDFPVRLFGNIDAVPRARFVTGSITALDGEGKNVTGGSFSLRLRWNFR